MIGMMYFLTIVSGITSGLVIYWCVVRTKDRKLLRKFAEVGDVEKLIEKAIGSHISDSHCYKVHESIGDNVNEVFPVILFGFINVSMGKFDRDKFVKMAESIALMNASHPFPQVVRNGRVINNPMPCDIPGSPLFVGDPDDVYVVGGFDKFLRGEADGDIVKIVGDESDVDYGVDGDDGFVGDW